MTSKERIFYYDFLRAFAIIAVIICHVMMFFPHAGSNAEELLQLAVHDIGRMGVPIFLMISGALLLRKDYELNDFLKRRFSRIIYPFLFWIILISLTVIYFGGNRTYVWYVFIGTNSVTWYFWTLIGIYLFIPVIKPFINEHGDKALKYFLAIWFVTVILNTFSSYPLWPYFDLNLFAGYVGYPILGYYLNTREFENSNITLTALALTIVSFGAYVAFTYYANPNSLTMTYINVPMVFLAGGMFLLAKNLKCLDSLPSKVKSAVTSISVCSYGMYFSHVIVMRFLAQYNTHSNMLFLVMLVLTVFLSWAPVYILSKIPYLKEVCGV